MPPSRPRTPGSAPPFIVAALVAVLAGCTSLPPTAAPASGVPESSASSAPASAGPWQAVGRLADARLSHGATLLLDGTVLVAGGWRSVLTLDGSRLSKALATVERFDPGSGAWTSVAPLRHARAEHSALLLADGRVLVIGGSVDVSGGAEDVRQPELFDPATGSWADMDPPPITTVLDAIRLADDRILVMGFGTGDEANVERIAMLDPATLTWQRLGNAPLPRVRPVVAQLDSGLVFVAGGWYPGDGEPRPASESMSYDPTSDTWQPLEAMPEVLDGAVGSRLPDGRLLMVGETASEIFDPVTGHWVAGPAPTGDRLGARAVSLRDGRVLFVGANPCTTTAGVVETYDPATSTWARVGEGEHVAGISATVLQDGRVLLAGGGRPCATEPAAFGPFAEAFLFDPTSTR